MAYLCDIFYQVYSPNVSGLRYRRSRICFWTHLVGILTQKIVSKLSEICSGFFIPDPDFLPILDPGIKKALDPGSGSATLIRSMRIPSASPLMWRSWVAPPAFASPYSALDGPDQKYKNKYCKINETVKFWYGYGSVDFTTEILIRTRDLGFYYFFGGLQDDFKL